MRLQHVGDLFSVYLQLVGDRPVISISLDRAEQLPAPLFDCVSNLLYFDPKIDPCPTLQGQNFAALAGVFHALKLGK